MQMRSSDDRNESEAERDNRNLMELVQELRVAGLGVQVLFGFLLSLPFTDGFAKLSHAQRGLFIADLVLAAVATVLLVGPVAYHRLVFRQHLKEPLVIVTNKMAIAGLAAGVISMLPSATGGAADNSPASRLGVRVRARRNRAQTFHRAGLSAPLRRGCHPWSPVSSPG